MDKCLVNIVQMCALPPPSPRRPSRSPTHALFVYMVTCHIAVTLNVDELMSVMSSVLLQNITDSIYVIPSHRHKHKNISKHSRNIDRTTRFTDHKK